MVKKRKIIRSIISYLPILKRLLRKSGTSPVDGHYYYNIYNSHKQKLLEAGFVFPSKIIAEIGPGDSLGVGMCAILDGFEKYYAFDIISHSDLTKNIKVLNDLKQYYADKIELIEKIEHEFKNHQLNNSLFQYENQKRIFEKVDLIISNAVLEHIIDLTEAYASMYCSLKPGGYCSHVIDYGAHEFSDIWYEHLYFSDFFWKFLMHGRMYPINRYPHSYHIKELKKVGFNIIHESLKYSNKADINKINKNLRPLFNDDDLSIKSAHIIAVKPDN